MDDIADTIDRCPSCGEPAHASESSDDGTCVKCAGVLQPPVPINPPTPREDDAISQAFSQAFAKARQTIAMLEAKRSENVDPSWSPAQHVRRAS